MANQNNLLDMWTLGSCVMDIRTFCRVLAAATVLGAALSASTPLSLAFVDRTGTPIACGTAFHATTDIAAREDSTNAQLHSARPALVVSDYAAQCSTLIASRRAIVVSVATVGAMIGVGSFYRRQRRPAHAVAPGRHRVQSVKVGAKSEDPVVDVTIRRATDAQPWSGKPARQRAAAQPV